MRRRPDRKSSPTCGSLALKICVWCAKSGCVQAAYPVSVAFRGAENMAIYYGCAEGRESFTGRAELDPLDAGGIRGPSRGVAEQDHHDPGVAGQVRLPRLAG